jgi:hypothetical protein
MLKASVKASIEAVETEDKVDKRILSNTSHKLKTRTYPWYPKSALQWGGDSRHARGGVRLSLGSSRSLGVPAVTVLWPTPLIPATDTARDPSGPGPSRPIPSIHNDSESSSEYRRPSLHWR